MLLDAWLPAYAGGIDVPLIVIVALAIDGLIGDPAWLYRHIPHPVAAFGALANWLERRFNAATAPATGRWRSGALVVLALALLAVTVGGVVAALARELPFGWIVEALAASSLFAFRGLYGRVNGVAAALARSLEDARGAVGHVVGRDPASLDRHGVARAAIESCAENFSDGVVAPALWYLALGLPGLALYKALNTLDSMFGHRTPRFADFGHAAARLDDAASWLPARLAGVMIATVAFLPRQTRGGAAWRVMLRDAPKHRSPNAGWQEAAMAGALALALAGPRHYQGVAVNDAWMGDGRRAATAADIRRALKVYLASGGLFAAALAVTLAL